MTGWIATIAQVIGVFGLSTRIVEPHIAFIIMSVGSVGWMFESAKMKLWSVFALNTAFTVSNLIGIYRWYS